MGSVSTATRRPSPGVRNRIWIDPSSGNMWRDDLTDWTLLRSGFPGMAYGQDVIPDPEFLSGTVGLWGIEDPSGDDSIAIDPSFDSYIAPFRSQGNSNALVWTPSCSEALASSYPANVQAGHTYELAILLGGPADGFVLLGDSEDMNDYAGAPRVNSDPFLYTVRWTPEDSFPSLTVLVVGFSNTTIYYAQVREVLPHSFPIQALNIGMGYEGVCNMESVATASSDTVVDVVNQLRSCMIQMGAITNGD